MIQLVNVSKQYIKTFYTVLNASTTFDCNTLIIGNDYGAVCLFRLISKIDKPTSGEIFIDEKSLQQIKDNEFNISYLPQTPILFKNKNVFKNLIYPLKIRKFNKNKAKNMVNDAILQLNFKNLAKKVSMLNLSEQKIIALMRANLRKPKYLLLENFFEDLDENYFELAFKILQSFSKDTLIIACEKEDKNLNIYKGFNRLKIENGLLNK